MTTTSPTLPLPPHLSTPKTHPHPRAKRTLRSFSEERAPLRALVPSCEPPRRSIPQSAFRNPKSAIPPPSPLAQRAEPRSHSKKRSPTALLTYSTKWFLIKELGQEVQSFMMKLKLLRISAIIAALYGTTFFVLAHLRTRPSPSVWCTVGTEPDTSSFEYRFHTFIVPIAIVPFEPYMWVRDSFGLGLGPWDFVLAPASLCLPLWILLWCFRQLSILMHRTPGLPGSTHH
jgi:hypothetical protein